MKNIKDLTFRNTALQARIERIATEQRQELRLARVPLVFRVLVTQCLKPCNTADRFARAGFDMIDVVVVYDAKVWDAVCAAAGVSYARCSAVSFILLLDLRSPMRRID
jgi:hypothetical protein